MDDQTQPQFDYPVPEDSQSPPVNAGPPDAQVPAAGGYNFGSPASSLPTDEPPDMFAAVDPMPAQAALQAAPPPPPQTPLDSGGYSFAAPPEPQQNEPLSPPNTPPVADSGGYDFSEAPDMLTAAEQTPPPQQTFPDQPQPAFTEQAQPAEVPIPEAQQNYDQTPPLPPDVPVASDQPSITPHVDAGPAQGTIFTGLSGNEMYCLNLVGYRPGNMVVGNSVYAIGFIGGVASNIRTKVGGEIQQFTNMISEGRKLSLSRLEKEMGSVGGHGATGVTSELVFHQGNIEFLSIGSTIYRNEGEPQSVVTSSSDGQEFYCQVDAGYDPVRFILGNVAYSIGYGRNILAEIKELTKGEIKGYSNVFNVTRNVALERIVQEAKDCGANSVIGIRTTILPIGVNGVQEMVMIGTASTNPKVAAIADAVGGVITSDLTAEETWNITKMGYVPMKLVLGTSVYSIGVAGGVRAAIRGYFKGEIGALTQMIYGAREQSLLKVQQQAQEIGADDVLGIKTYIYQLGGDVIEFLAIGTAVKRVEGINTRSEQIHPQAVITDKTTFINTADMSYNTSLNQSSVDHGDQKNIV
jgi:uncharacterized protein YbjQ (UPF0145 family)